MAQLVSKAIAVVLLAFLLSWWIGTVERKAQARLAAMSPAQRSQTNTPNTHVRGWGERLRVFLPGVGLVVAFVEALSWCLRRPFARRPSAYIDTPGFAVGPPLLPGDISPER